MRKKILFSLFFLIFFKPSFSDEIIGSAKIIDGDTLKIENKKIRLLGIDAPEIKQTCKKPYLTIALFTFYQDYNCGENAKLQLEKYIKKKIIKCIYHSKDKWNRLIGECYLEKKSINSWMVKNGYAISYRKYSKKFILEEEYAKKNKLGLWQGTFVIPEKWRKKNKYN